MTEIFLFIINRSITASILAAVVLLLRMVLKKAPKWVSVLLWGLVALRLVCPFAVESPFSLMPKTDWIEQETLSEEDLFLDSVPDSIPAVDFSVFVEDISVDYSYYPLENPEMEIHRGISVSFILACVWIAGMAALLLHTVLSTVRLRRSIGAAIRVRENIWESSAVDSPFVLGIIRPRIYVPRGLSEEKLAYVVAHERAHISRRDHWWKPIGFLLLTIHWFNPVLWIAYILLCRDIEMACDEKVVRDMGEAERADYSEALLECSIKRSMISACPLAFGEVGVKQRIQSVLNYKKPAFWIVVLAVIACIVAAFCFLTNPVDQGDPINEEDSYFMMIEEEGIAEIRISTTTTSGGCIHADNTLFEIGEKVWLDNLDNIVDLRGVEVAAVSELGETVYSVAFPETATNQEIEQLLLQTEWFIPPESVAMKYKSVEEGTENIIASNIADETLTYWTLKGHLEEIWAYSKAIVSASIIIEYQEKIISTACNPGENYVTVFVHDFTEEDVRRFENTFGHLSYILVSVEEPIETSPESQTKLTLDDVIELSAKGSDLTWEDFADFNFTETGSGLYIRLYEIDETFSLWIGGGSPVTTPMYIYLSANGLDNRIDIRDGSVEAFVNEINKLYSKTPISALAMDMPMDLNAASGVGCEIDYENEDFLIFHGDFGLFAYDLNECRILFTIDFVKAIGIPGNVQGSYGTAVEVSKDADIILISEYNAETDIRGKTCRIELITGTYSIVDYKELPDVFDKDNIQGYVYPGVKREQVTYTLGDIAWNIFELNSDYVTEAEARDIAVNEAKHNYDEMTAYFDYNRYVWCVCLWEAKAKLPAQIVYIDTTGNYIGSSFAE